MSVFTTVDSATIDTTGSDGVNHGLTGALALVGGTLAVAAVGGGIGVVGAFGAVGIGAFEIFTGGALLSGAAAHTAQKNLSKKQSVWGPVPTPADQRDAFTINEIDDLRSGRF